MVLLPVDTCKIFVSIKCVEIKVTETYIVAHSNLIGGSLV